MLKLAVEVEERPELYDFRFGSGVVRNDEGVLVFLGINDGDFEEARAMLCCSGCVGGVYGIGGTPGTIDMRFALRASVGLIVLAPRPVA